MVFLEKTDLFVKYLFLITFSEIDLMVKIFDRGSVWKLKENMVFFMEKSQIYEIRTNDLFKK